MPQRNHRRQIVLFLVAIVVPSLVLVVLSLRMIGQERRLEAVPTARYDAVCQAAIESADGSDENPTL